jgi:hypothetical protein
MLKFTGSWRFESPGPIPNGVVREVSDLIGKITTQGDVQPTLEHFKSYFASATGTTSSWSSSASWAESDLWALMEAAAKNAPLFIEAFYDGCSTLTNVDVPDVKLMNRILAKHDVGYEIRPPNLISLDEDVGPVNVPQESPSLDQQAQEIIQASLSQSEQLFAENRNRQAVQEVLWLLETVSTSFQGLEVGTGTVQGKYFNKIVAGLRRNQQGTTLNQVLDWITTLHGYLSSPTGGGIRHGTSLKTGVGTRPHEARLFCNLIRSYIAFLIAEHEGLTGSSHVLDEEYGRKPV